MALGPVNQLYTQNEKQSKKQEVLQMKGSFVSTMVMLMLMTMMQTIHNYSLCDCLFIHSFVSLFQILIEWKSPTNPTKMIQQH